MYCSKCGQQIADNVSFCSHCGEPTQQPVLSDTTGNSCVNLQPELSMKWFKFLINFALFASAVLNTINGISMLTGGQYGGEAELVYAMLDGLKGFDTLMGIFALALAAFCVFVRFQLSGYKKSGPTMIFGLYVAVCIFDLVYIIGLNSILPDYVMAAVDLSSVYGGFGASVAIAIGNYVYFKKRQHLFVN